MADSAHTKPGRRKRPRVADADRKRVTQACEACRRAKEKCDGVYPCTRCKRLKRVCDMQDYEVDMPTTQRRRPDNRADFLNVSRIQAMEEIVRHYAGSISLDTNSVKQYLTTLKTNSDNTTAVEILVTPSDSSSSKTEYITPLDRIETRYTLDALSHCRFFDSVQNKIDEQTGKPILKGQPVTATVVLSRTARLRSENALIQKAAAKLPPIEVARFLVDMFFQFAETNYAYVDETWFRRRFESIYSDLTSLQQNDASALCVTLMVLALGTQFAHLSSSASFDNTSTETNDILQDIISPDDHVALALYHAATTLVSDILIIASIESVQAFLLLGVYTLPIDAAGLSYHYLGIALRLAVQNYMHRKPVVPIDATFHEQRNRIWWTVYSLESRISILHGMPTTLPRSEVVTPLPTHAAVLEPSVRPQNMANFISLINLTKILEDAGDTIFTLRDGSQETRSSTVLSLSEVSHNLSVYWHSLPETVVCRDIEPTGALFRPNIHLALFYHLIHMFIGRTFIFNTPNGGAEHSAEQEYNSNWNKIRSELVSECMKSALSIIQLCVLLQNHIGLARASYTEFSSCRTAVLVIIARRISDDSYSLRCASETGLELLKFMSVGMYSAAAEKAAIKAMETAVRRLNGHAVAAVNSDTSELPSAYDNFRNWARLWNNDDSEQNQLPKTRHRAGNVTMTSSSVPPDTSQSNLLLSPGNDLDSILSNFPFELDDFPTMSDFDPNFTLNIDLSNT